MFYLPDSHNARSFLSRMLAPGGWPAKFWAALLLVNLMSGCILAFRVVEHARRSDSTLLTTTTHIAGHSVSEATRGRHATPRSILLRPTEGNTLFVLVDPYDRLLEPIPSVDQQVIFSFYKVDCDLHSNRSATGYVRLCRPSQIQVGAVVLLPSGRVHRASVREIVGWGMVFLGTIAAALYGMFSTRRR